MNVTLVRTAILATALAGAFCTPALAETMTYTADLKGSSEVPPNDTKGTGKVDATYDSSSKKLTWTVTYSGLTGPATAAHFHGPAAAGKNAPPVVPLKGDLKSPVKGEATLTDAQAKEFADGEIYFNLHTAAHKDGEIRGQMMKK